MDQILSYTSQLHHALKLTIFFLNFSKNVNFLINCEILSWERLCMHFFVLSCENEFLRFQFSQVHCFKSCFTECMMIFVMIMRVNVIVMRVFTCMTGILLFTNSNDIITMMNLSVTFTRVRFSVPNVHISRNV